MIQATQLRAGMIIVHEGDLYRVLNITHITQGNKRGKVQSDLRNLKTGIKTEYRFRSEDSIEKANLSQKEMEFLYNDGESYHFMDSTTYEQILLMKDTLGNAPYYLKPNTKVTVAFYEERPIGVELPATMNLKIAETQPPMKGATAAGGAKPATLENGLSVKVPQFIQVGDTVRVDTSTNEYVERVSNQ